MARFLVSTLMFMPDQFPWATLAINIAGSFAIGLHWASDSARGRYLLVVGVPGQHLTDN